MEEIRERMSEKGLSIKLSAKARKWLANEGYDKAFGARPLTRALQKYVESPLSKRVLAGEFVKGSTVLVDVDEEGKELIFDDGKSAKAKTPKKEEQEIDA
jgi:ATP-dependent Clp protease ATP-binding subunit ClpA